MRHPVGGPDDGQDLAGRRGSRTLLGSVRIQSCLVSFGWNAWASGQDLRIAIRCRW